jgi:hypothetical protein
MLFNSYTLTSQHAFERRTTWTTIVWNVIVSLTRWLYNASGTVNDTETIVATTIETTATTTGHLYTFTSLL